MVHDRYVHPRRCRALARGISALLAEGASVLDVGCGDGLVAQEVMRLRPDVGITGLDVLVRPGAFIRVTEFNGAVLPFGDATFDVVVLVDVVHHANDPYALLAECARVAGQSVVIKDHLCEGRVDAALLAFMDYRSNEHHGVASPGLYWSRREWDDAFTALGLRVAARQMHLRLYPRPADWALGPRRHFLARLEHASSPERTT